MKSDIILIIIINYYYPFYYYIINKIRPDPIYKGISTCSYRANSVHTRDSNYVVFY